MYIKGIKINHSRRRIMDRNQVKTLHAALKEVLAQFAKDHNLAFECNNVAYTNASFTPKVTFTEKAADGSVALNNVLKSKIEWALLREGHGDLHAEDIWNKKFYNFCGEVVTVVDFNPKGKHYPWIVSKANGALVKCSIDVLCGFQKPAA